MAHKIPSDQAARIRKPVRKSGIRREQQQTRRFERVRGQHYQPRIEAVFLSLRIEVIHTCHPSILRIVIHAMHERFADNPRTALFGSRQMRRDHNVLRAGRTPDHTTRSNARRAAVVFLS